HHRHANGSDTLSLHDALPIFGNRTRAVPIEALESTRSRPSLRSRRTLAVPRGFGEDRRHGAARGGEIAGGGRTGIGTARGRAARSEEHTSELQSRENLVCRLL